jgi:hypothetical protein
LLLAVAAVAALALHTLLEAAVEQVDAALHHLVLL